MTCPRCNDERIIRRVKEIDEDATFCLLTDIHIDACEVCTKVAEAEYQVRVKAPQTVAEVIELFKRGKAA